MNYVERYNLQILAKSLELQYSLVDCAREQKNILVLGFVFFCQ